MATGNKEVYLRMEQKKEYSSKHHSRLHQFWILLKGLEKMSLNSMVFENSNDARADIDTNL